MTSFAQGGYYGTSLNDIAERAGISRRGLGHHFRSKEELLEAVLQVQQDDDARTIRGTSGIDALVAVLVISTRNRERPGFVQLYSLLRADATAPEHPAHDHHREQYDQLRLFLTVAFDTVRERGELDSDEESEVLAASLLALMDGLQLQWLYNRTAIDLQAIVRAYLKSIIPTFPDVALTAPTNSRAN